MKSKIFLIHSLRLVAFFLKAQNKQTETIKNTHIIIQNKGSQTLDYSVKSGVKILQLKGLALKDHNKNGKLGFYEDWRKRAAERAKDPANLDVLSFLLRQNDKLNSIPMLIFKF